VFIRHRRVRLVYVDPFARRHPDQIALVGAPLFRTERGDRTLSKREFGVGHDQVRIQTRHAPEPLARRACTEWRVERKQLGSGLLEREPIPLEVSREGELSTGRVLCHGHDHGALAALPECLLHRIGNARSSRLVARSADQAIDEHHQSVGRRSNGLGRSLIEIHYLGLRAALAL
jgi:hypothetical protein